MSAHTYRYAPAASHGELTVNNRKVYLVRCVNPAPWFTKLRATVVRYDDEVDVDAILAALGAVRVRSNAILVPKLYMPISVRPHANADGIHFCYLFGRWNPANKLNEMFFVSGPQDELERFFISEWAAATSSILVYQ